MGTQDTVLQKYTTLMGFRAQRLQSKTLKQWEAALRHTLFPFLPPVPGASAILDAGCGDGALLRLLQKWGYPKVSGFDISRENVAACHSDDLTFVEVWDVCRIGSFQSGRTWDVIIMWDVIEHLPKDQVVPVLCAARSRLSPGGCLLLQTPNMGSLFGMFCRYNDVTHETGFSEYSLRTVLSASGFLDIRVVPCWRRATPSGRVRECALRVAHFAVWSLYGKGAPLIASTNLIAQARESL